MQSMRRLKGLFTAALLLVLAGTAAAQDANITQPVADLEQLLAAEPLVITAGSRSAGPRPRVTSPCGRRFPSAGLRHCA